MSPTRFARISSAAIVILVLLSSGVATATSVQGDADPMPGFGVLIAVVAIVIASIIAHRKRKQYTSD